MPKLSYLVSTYNAGYYLHAHMADLLKFQTDPDFETIIINPASPCADGVIAQRWAIEDRRVKYSYSPERETYGESWLRTWKYASGEFVINSNTDDFHHPRTTELIFQHMHRTVK